MSRIRHFLLPKSVANTGSQLRDHQANERTFLSWTRMGLAFAAMGLAFGRLHIIDHFLSTHGNLKLNVILDDPSMSPESQNIAKNNESKPRLAGADGLASNICQAISFWSFGYGIFRYLSSRRNLMQGRFVPALWGPILMTTGSIGVFGAALHTDFGSKPLWVGKKGKKDEASH
ncbi:hypothetical protein BGW36DRAFT_377359 [Talaromyces proteolyticus]|uniref:DUF202 domain-containing protein n=1 Tax=Talaromyces proteolyticus TaxID=1131652 RepID=A0AAD4KVD2_9EURO|nr:uncharacterized protein BGW36DRAFT_377359 [Talaromyces proteolyticus]KAH8699144.1 hypothetical protein BGW36DRAFT_377359 [Talaromyces proteolyticus]